MIRHRKDCNADPMIDLVADRGELTDAADRSPSTSRSTRPISTPPEPPDLYGPGPEAFGPLRADREWSPWGLGRTGGGCPVEVAGCEPGSGTHRHGGSVRSPLNEVPPVPKDAPAAPDVHDGPDACHLAVLRYDAARAEADPRAAVLAFYESAYQAGAVRAGWDVARLACPGGITDPRLPAPPL
ncbi:DUF5996 family protein [Kitasatospora camelliae]|uniref:DUF5996 family protein n=1 Tax=Kitasatospora camelliae TaxID=3156397 RepID=A0AAU8K6R2_9ACTN